MASKDAPWLAKSDVLSLFPTLVWRLDLSPDLYEQMNAEIAQALRTMNPQLGRLTAGQIWQSETRLHELEAFRSLVRCIRRAARTVLEFLKIGEQAIEVTGCWANVGPLGASHPMHSHPNNFLSGVYYVRTSPGADTINFHDPRPQASVVQPPVTELTGQNTDQVVVKVTDGTMLIFPSYLVHSVSPIDNEVPRISISFNVMFSRFPETMSKPLWSATGARSDDQRSL